MGGGGGRERSEVVDYYIDDIMRSMHAGVLLQVRGPQHNNYANYCKYEPRCCHRNYTKTG